MAAGSESESEILDYISSHAPYAETDYGISQAELATALGFHRCSMSRPLASMVEQGLLATRRGPARGAVRKQLVYSLTPLGKSRLRKSVGLAMPVAGTAPPPPNPFVGRSAELKELMDFSTHGRAVIVVEGPSGMGKSALISRHIRRVKRTSILFWFAVRPGSSARHFTAALARTLAPIGGQQRLAYYTQLRILPMGREVGGLAQQALDSRRLVAVIDDTHLADSEFARFLSEFPAGFGREREDLFFFLSQGPVSVRPTDYPIHRLVVGGLDRKAAHELTDRRGGLGDRFEEVYRTTVGSPALLLLATTAGGDLSGSAYIPASLVSGFNADEREALLPLVLSEEPLPLSIFRDSALTPSRIDELVRIGVMSPTSDDRVELLQVIRDELLKQTLGPAEREAHRKLADYYQDSNRPEAIRERFVHSVAAEDWKSATELLVGHETSLLASGYGDSLRGALRQLGRVLPAGATRARAAALEAQFLSWHSDFPGALVALRKAIGDSEGDAKHLVEYWTRCVEAHLRLGETETARDALLRAGKYRIRNRRLRYAMRIASARIREAEGDRPGALNAYEEVFMDARDDKLPDVALEGLQHWSYIEALGPDPARAVRLADEGIPESRKFGRLDITCNLMLVRARGLAMLGRMAESEATLQSTRREAESLGLLTQVAIAVSGLSATAIQEGRWSDASRYGREAIEMAERLGNEQVMANTLSYMCSSLMRQADLPETSAADRAALLEEAYRHGTKAIDLLVRLPKSTGLVFALGFLTETCFAMGKMDEAVERLATADKIAEELEWTVWPTLAAELHQKRDLHVTRSTPRTAGNSEAFPPASGGSAIPRGG